MTELSKPLRTAITVVVAIVLILAHLYMCLLILAHGLGDVPSGNLPANHFINGTWFVYPISLFTVLPYVLVQLYKSNYKKVITVVVLVGILLTSLTLFDRCRHRQDISQKIEALNLSVYKSSATDDYYYRDIFSEASLSGRDTKNTYIGYARQHFPQYDRCDGTFFIVVNHYQRDKSDGANSSSSAYQPENRVLLIEEFEDIIISTYYDTPFICKEYGANGQTFDMTGVAEELFQKYVDGIYKLSDEEALNELSQYRYF